MSDWQDFNNYLDSIVLERHRAKPQQHHILPLICLAVMWIGIYFALTR